MAKAKILVVDDDVALAEMIGIILNAEDYETIFCADGAEAVEAFRQAEPDVVLLDLMLPGKDGIQICGEIREFSDTSIVMLTAKSDTDDVVRGLEAGADDYIPKPFKPAELLARVKARLRPGSRATSTELVVGDVTVDITGHRVLRGQEEIALTPLEFELLATLARSPEQVFTRDMLLRQVWGYHNAADTRLVNVHVQRLRSKVERDPENPQIIVTVRGVGYRAGHEHR
ncbi:MtrAB system response regulator MtrA [Kocuria palustris]|uniref:MtrAB system response regulator MtrA n=1 Tax=Kocuria palustris TaxID=71999 RepID=UPI00344EE845